MKLKLSVLLVVMMLACFVSRTNAQKAAPILDKISRSLPQMDPGWKHGGTEAHERDDGSTQASIKWSNGDIERSATVIVYPTVKRAQRAFGPSGKEDLQEEFRIDGVGDEAFLWPPKAPEGGAYNMRFRKAEVEVWISGSSEGDVKRYARAIAAAITPTNKRMQRSGDNRVRMFSSVISSPPVDANRSSAFVGIRPGMDSWSVPR